MNDTTFQGDGKLVFVPVVVNANPPKQTNADRMKWEGIIGANGDREPYDFYSTPQEVTIALENFLSIPSSARIWDPACGDGAIIEVLSWLGYQNCVGTDIQTGTDFLKEDIGPVDWIITNPPLSLADEFIIRAAEFDVPFAFLLKSQYWYARKRIGLFKEFQPRFVLPLTWRPDFTGGGRSLMNMCWCIWDGAKVSGCTIYQPISRPKKIPGYECERMAEDENRKT